MLYLAGDNNLTEDMVLALQDLVAEGPPPGYKIVALFDPGGESLFTQWYDFNVTTLADGTGKTRVDQFLVKCTPTTNTGSQKALTEFIKPDERWISAEVSRAELVAPDGVSMMVESDGRKQDRLHP